MRYKDKDINVEKGLQGIEIYIFFLKWVKELSKIKK